MKDTEIRYTRLEKLTFALLIAARRLQPYFQGHMMVILIDQLIKAVLHQLDTSGMLAKRAIKLMELDIKLQPWASSRPKFWQIL